MADMEERQVKGTIAYWTKEIKEEVNQQTGNVLYRAAFHLDTDDENTWHKMYAEAKDKLENLKAEAPKGSKVEFVEHKTATSKYWNFKPGTFTVTEKGTGQSFKKFGERFGIREMRVRCMEIAAGLAEEKAALATIISYAQEIAEWVENKPAAPILEEDTSGNK